jgi:hypothetical protein
MLLMRWGAGVHTHRDGSSQTSQFLNMSWLTPPYLQELRDSGSALLLAACADLDRANATSAAAGAASPVASAPFTCYYAARPAADCAALLIRR